ncbi:MAG TPA: PQQ-binding-like beta-propeller repeat protein [Planctomycetaceae bacterium]|nr:PQQ-binding-like beta-propeller repeat protein [Planctomycetaceae bacterium]
MRIVCKVLLFTLGVGLAASVALAQPPEESRDHAPKIDKAAAADALVSRMMAFDKNKDGKLTRDEITDTRLVRMFDRADANHDGVVTRDELVTWAAKAVEEDVESRNAPGLMGPPDGGPGGPGPGGPERRRGRGGRGFGGRGAGAFGPRSQPGQILSASIIQTLKLTDQQKKDEADLQKHVDEELGKMLTAKQKQRLKDIQQVSRPDGFGSGRRGRRGPGRPPGQDAAPSDRGPGGPPDGNGPPDGARRGPDGPPDGGRPDRGLAERGPGGPPPGFGGPGFGGPGFGGPGRFGGPAATPGQILSPTVVSELNLKSQQKQQLKALQKDVEDKLAVLLTDDQKRQFNEMKQSAGRGGPNGRRRGVPGFGGPMEGPPGGERPAEKGSAQSARESNNPAPGVVASIGPTEGSTSAPSHAENWPQWRGPDYDGLSHETNLPTTWSESSNVLWKLEMPGMGGSTPSVWEKHIFLTSQDGDNLVLVCASTDGKQLWKRQLGTNRPIRGDEGNGASPSPSTDGKHVFAFVGSGQLACFDFDGKEVWIFNAQDRYGRFQTQHGMHTTPLLYQDRLYMQVIHSGGAWVICLDPSTGKEVWKVPRKSDGYAENEHSYASPCLWHRGADAYLITHGNDYAIAHRLTDGSEIWRVGELNPKSNYRPDLRFVASPVATPDLIVVPTAKSGAVVGIRPDATGIIMPGSAGELWRLERNSPDVPSPLVVNGLVYLCRETGVLMCLDARTGKQLYSQRTHTERHRASPVYADGKVYLTARDGVVTVIKAGPTYNVLATNRLEDHFTASPAISNGRIYLRGFDSLYAIGLSK